MDKLPASGEGEPTTGGDRTLVARLLDASAPLLLGLAAALVFANVDGAGYQRLVHSTIDAKLLGHEVSFHFLVNDGFMTLFFGLAAREILTAVRPGGTLFPPRRAANAMLASVGGVVAPAVVYIALIHGLFRNVPDHELLMGAWAVPTATDIALVWLAARLVFGRKHPAVDYVLLLAVLDDLIGLVIIAVIYSGAEATLRASGIALVATGIAVAWGLRRQQVRWWPAYVVLAGGPVWLGLLQTPIHPALALVPIVPFFPLAVRGGQTTVDVGARFERALKPVVDVGLFAFGFANAGVAFGDVMFVTWVVLASLVVGKTIGIAAVSLAAARWLGLALPDGVSRTQVLVIGLLASTGVTVSLFIAGQAFPADSAYQGAARMGSVFSLVVVVAAFVWSRATARVARGRREERRRWRPGR